MADTKQNINKKKLCKEVDTNMKIALANGNQGVNEQNRKENNVQMQSTEFIFKK